MFKAIRLRTGTVPASIHSIKAFVNRVPENVSGALHLPLI